MCCCNLKDAEVSGNKLRRMCEEEQSRTRIRSVGICGKTVVAFPSRWCGSY
jgi:hypothetical protein